jgi:hypothetical protein
MAAAAIPSSTTTFRITPKSGIWRVTSDDLFFGDYRARQWALIGAQEGALAIRSSGRAARILVMSASGAIESDQTLSPL